jgi:AcrR family transcriptional regulator
LRCKTPRQADKILAAAARLFATHRFHEARMEDIAALAEVGKGTLYRYFKDKEELYLALLHRAAEGLLLRLQEAMAAHDSPRAQLLRVVEGLLAYFDEQPHLLDLIQHAEVMHRSDQEFPWQAVRRQTMTLVKDILMAGTRAGEFHITDVDLAVLMLLGGLRAVFRFGATPRPEGLATQIVAGFLSGFACPTTEPRPTRSTSRSARTASVVPTPPGQVIDGTSSSLHNA